MIGQLNAEMAALELRVWGALWTGDLLEQDALLSEEAQTPIGWDCARAALRDEWIVLEGEPYCVPAWFALRHLGVADREAALDAWYKMVVG